MYVFCNGFETQVDVLVIYISTSIGASVESKQIAEDGKVSFIYAPLHCQQWSLTACVKVLC